MVQHTQTIRRQQLTNCLSVFDHLEVLSSTRFGMGFHSLALVANFSFADCV